jgi:uncharacterized protein YsxB (DUF464 family)
MLVISANERYFIVRGHADYAESGKDIVCSAVSFLVQCVANQLQHYDETFQRIEPGFAHVECVTQSDQTKVLMRLFKEETRKLARQYPENIQMEDE